MKKNYDYSLSDESVLTPYIYRYLVDPLLKVTPSCLPANIITLISNLFVVLGFIIITAGYANNSYCLYWLAPIFVIFYVIGDALDGKQARKTKTGSQLGEFFDHFLDTIVSGLLIGMLLMSLRIASPFILFIALFCTYLAQSSAFYERYFTGVMYFGRIGSNEGVAVIVLLLFFSPLLAMLNSVTIFGSSILSILIFFPFALGPISSAFKSIVRSGELKREYLIYLALNIFVVSSAAALYDIPVAVILVTLFNVEFIENLLISTGLKQDIKEADLLVPTVILVAAIIGYTGTLLMIFLSLYLGAKIVLRFVKFFKEFKDCWYWENPVITEEN